MSKVIELKRNGYEGEFDILSWEEIKEDVLNKINSGDKVVARSKTEYAALAEIILSEEKYSHVQIVECISRYGSMFEVIPIEKDESKVMFPPESLEEVYAKEMDRQGRVIDIEVMPTVLSIKDKEILENHGVEDDGEF